MKSRPSGASVSAERMSDRSCTRAEASPSPVPERTAAAVRAFTGQVPPASSAMASSGRQLSAARSWRPAGTSGSAWRSRSVQSCAHRIGLGANVGQALGDPVQAQALDLLAG